MGFSAGLIDAFNSGLAARRAEEDQAFQRQLRGFQIKQLQHETNRYKLMEQADEIQAAMQQRNLQAMMPGGPTGQATVVTPTYQPQNLPPPPADTGSLAPNLPQSAKDLIMRIRAQGVTPQMSPISGLSQSEETGTPPPYPDIPIPSLGISIPGTNLERARAAQLAADAATERVKALNTPFNLGPQEKRFLGQDVMAENTNQRPAEGEYQELLGTFPNFTNMSDVQKLQALTQFHKAKATQTEGMIQMNDWLARNPGKGPADFAEHMKTIVPQLNFNLQNPQGSAEEVSYWTKQVRDDPKNFGLIKSRGLQQQVASQLASEGVDVNQIDAMTRDAAKFSTTALKHIGTINSEIDQLDKDGKLGPIMGRWNDFLAGKVGASDPDFAKLRNNIMLLDTAMGRVHGGARGGGSPIMMEHFKSMLNAGTMDKATLKSGLSVFQDWLQNYAGMAKSSSAAPAQGSGGKTLDEQTAARLLIQAKGNKDEARRLATEAGYEVK
jgi:hypothetical protein